MSEEIEDGFDGKSVSAGLTLLPGVYRMVDGEGQVLYVGKARSLRKRVSSYFQGGRQHSPRVRAMVGHVRHIEVTVTRTEAEALLLECNLIKSLRPRYNILLRDDKSYPYIRLVGGDWPRLGFHRGLREGKDRYFGPFASAGAVRASLNLLQKLFRIRGCEDTFFRNRTRPCLQHQIGRCSAPCVGLVDAEVYAEDVRHAVMFLEGRSAEVIQVLVNRMEQAANELAFERAAHLRDQVAQLRRVQGNQYVSGESGDVDVIACAVEGGIACVQVFSIRNGVNLGNQPYFPRQVDAEAPAEEVLAAFLPQYYLGGGERPFPERILLSHSLEEAEDLALAFTSIAGRKVVVHVPERGSAVRWVDMGLENARLALARTLSERNSARDRLIALAEALNAPDPIERIECFDISHTQGEATVASCVVFGAEGPVKSDYRRFNITDITPGDDYAAMRQALNRRYTRLAREEARLPDLLLIDGGAGQVAEAVQVLNELQLSQVRVLGVAKGPARKAGAELLVSGDEREAPRLRPESAALHLIQQIRDEAHRFAITGHRKQRAAVRTQSLLEEIEGVGAKRRRSLIQHFGGLRGVAAAGVDELCRVPGINRALAERIYATFRSGVEAV
jgi:excinuclease ABC subunit C